ncbi:Swt1 family HEPN domain-containing protein [Methylobacterium sp. R2-1]|uniref:Swt1 family HEPN domain-containing protein n=1 Tax=Methylobacterium sp. R2-1 TaxID=2587064 RepID=UPI001849DDC1|nr:Swt1 family HEPN domain-containing protein [Methylobacterium sp. R2-1]MBB2961928.1 hypothetical protein [Methylobacterium sp. R2-1]
MEMCARLLYRVGKVEGDKAMSDQGKKLLDLASGVLANLGSTSVFERTLEAQRSVEKLTASGVLGDDRLGRMARGLPAGEIRTATDFASGRITTLDPFLKGGPLINEAQRDALKLHDPFERHDTIRSAIEEATGRANSFETSAFGRAYDAATNLWDPHNLRFGSLPDGHVAESMRRLTEPCSALTASQTAMLGIDRDAASALARTQRWADALIKSPTRDYAELLGIGVRCNENFTALHLAAGRIAAATAGLDASSYAARSVALGGDLAGMGATATKMSLFSASLDVLGPGAGSSQAAYAALLGSYETSAMLARPYWRDPRERARYYRDQDVDEGLIDADNATTVAVLIDSGVVEGRRTRAGTLTAIVEAGPVKVRIVANRPKMGAFAAIDTFENALRAFVAAKLAALQGQAWFKQRVPGDTVKRAKDRRKEALRAGEPSLDLIHYTDLGDLIGVITRNDNWTELFEAVFDRAEWLKVDLERLNAFRRPTMHSRPVDPVQLCEIVFTIRRLVGWMERDSEWDRGWDADI